MAQIRPFAGIRYSPSAGADESDFIAPPYDVLDAAGKAALLARSPFNIAAIDCPHMPPKTVGSSKSVGPPECYAQAGETMRSWLDKGVLTRSTRRATYGYEQSYTLDGHPHHRRGLIVLVKLTPLGVDVIPHEQTHAGPIEDRLRLMEATGAQLSPVFGLFMDRGDAIMGKVFASVSKPTSVATLDGVTNKVWEIIDSALEDQLQIDFKDKKIYIADGHHRYTTALHYQRSVETLNGGPLPANHPANYCMFVLVNGEDSSLRVLPTHRLLGGMEDWSFEKFLRVAGEHFEVTRTPQPKSDAGSLAKALTAAGRGAIGVYGGAAADGLAVLKLRDPTRMRALEPDKSDAWRGLDVAVFQRLIFDELIAKHFAQHDGTLHRAYTADAGEAMGRVDSGEFNVGFILQPTPISALAALGAAGETMPQKSTYFFPKLATGLVMNPLR